jgi:monoamine oxidase
MEYDVIIAGAGAAGLIAGYDLSIAGLKVLILEARHRIGGRAFTLAENGFTAPVETGAEFVHGKLPISLSLLDKAGIHYTEMPGRSYTVKQGKLLQDEEFGMDWGALMKKLSSLENDLPLIEFLTAHFAGNEYAELRDSVIRFAQGFDAADPAKVSTLSLKNEWMNDNEDNQFRIDGGYVTLMQWLSNELIKQDGHIDCAHKVASVDHSGTDVTIKCSNDAVFTAKKVLITISLGSWQRQVIKFLPALIQKEKAAAQMGFGNVIKFNIEFTHSFWEEKSHQGMPGAAFIFSDAAIPTWWTQNPAKTPQLSGWLAGPPADAYNGTSEADMKILALDSLCYIFRLTKREIESTIKSIVITNWGNDPFARGGYSYETLQSATAKKVLEEPVNNRLFFAGEALYDGSHTGTVEAAFVSGRRAALSILNKL